MRVKKVLEDSPPEQVVQAAVEAMSKIHSVPAGDCGLGEEPAVTLDSELTRWQWLMDRAPVELTVEARTLHAALEASRPVDPEPRMVHGDYHYGNLLFGRDATGGLKVVGVLDWEIAERGAPLLDVSSLCVFAQAHRDYPAFRALAGGVELPTEEVLGICGEDLETSRWYLAAGAYKYAAIFGYNLALHRRGKRPDAVYEELAGVVPALIRSALQGLN
jgi:aminoglycoside phosphotransferase (APT) family kinase protein